jgi:hypothetical protein
MTFAMIRMNKLVQQLGHWEALNLKGTLSTGFCRMTPYGFQKAVARTDHCASN